MDLDGGECNVAASRLKNQPEAGSRYLGLTPPGYSMPPQGGSNGAQTIDGAALVS
jgi:hypothetical protein